MSKELEYIQRHIDMVKQQVKGSKMKIIVTDAVTKHQYDYYENELQTLESIEKSLQRLESIDNANPSEALRKLDDISYLVLNEIDDLKNKELWKSYFTTIKQALLKAQEPKQYVDELKLVEKKLKALEIIKEKPFESADCINYLTINKNNSNMLDYKHYCMTIKDTLAEEEFNTIKEVEE